MKESLPKELELSRNKLRSSRLSREKEGGEFLWLLLLLGIGLFPRAFLLFVTNNGIESDEAIVGLMGKHILEGRPWPVFYYGQHYMGSLEPTLVAGAFALLGISNFALKLIPLLFSLGFLGCVYALARRVTDVFGARVATLLTALGPSALILWSTKARGGFIELLVIGSIAFIITMNILSRPLHRGCKLFFLGLSLGLGWWVNNQIIFYFISITAILVISDFKNLGVERSVRAALSLLLGAVLLLGGFYGEMGYEKAFLLAVFVPVFINFLLRNRWDNQIRNIVFAILLTAVFDITLLSLAVPKGVVLSVTVLFLLLLVFSLNGAGALLGFLLGGAPFWWANITSSPPFQSFSVLTGRAELQAIPSQIQGFFTEALPIIVGARRFWGVEDTFPYATVLCTALYGVVFVLLFSFATLHFMRGEKSRAYQLFLLLGFSFTVPLIFSISAYGWLSKAPRYLLPLYSVLFVAVGVVVSRIRLSQRREVRVFSLVIPSVLLGVHLASNYLGGVAKPGQPFVYRGERVSDSHQELYAWLEENSYEHIYANYWIGYRTAFETRERVTFTRYQGPKTLRIPEYEQQSGARKESGAYVLVPLEAKQVAASFLERGLVFRETRVGGYIVLDHVRPGYERGPKLSLTPLQLAATSRKEWIPFIVDGQRGTRWGSGEPQHPKMQIEVAFEKSTFVTGIDIDMGFYKTDWPRGLQIELEGEGGERCVIFDSAGNETVLEEERILKLFFPPQKVRKILLHQTRTHPVLDWSIAELSVYGL